MMKRAHLGTHDAGATGTAPGSGAATEDYYARALAYARHFQGKVGVVPRVPVTKLLDFAVWYTPGVAEVSRAVARDPEESFHLTGRWNTIAILTDGSRVLGLGNIGPEAAMPVMEGKSMIFKYLGGVDAVPLPVRVSSVDELLAVGRAIEPAFGGINLEDIESPKCFRVLETLRSELKITVWHDDQQGTAGATLAGLLNALKVTGRKLRSARIVLSGAGAANIATARLLVAAGAEAGNLVLVDSVGTLHPAREDMDQLMLKNPWKYDLGLRTNKERVAGGLPDALKGADVLVAASKPGPGTVKQDWVRKMATDSIVFALANPVPEIWPQEALEAGARVVATGRSDLPNQVNNSMVFPAVFRGALDARARTVSDEMVIEASHALAAHADSQGLSEKRIIPTMEDWDVFPVVAAKVARKAVDSGIARLRRSEQEFRETAEAIILNTRRSIEKMMRSGLIPPFPDASGSPSGKRGG
jgi:malate dehydrogenase (oxaloacetate-decarboxylating)